MAEVTNRSIDRRKDQCREGGRRGRSTGVSRRRWRLFALAVEPEVEGARELSEEKECVEIKRNSLGASEAYSVRHRREGEGEGEKGRASGLR